MKSFVLFALIFATATALPATQIETKLIDWDTARLNLYTYEVIAQLSYVIVEAMAALDPTELGQEFLPKIINQFQESNLLAKPIFQQIEAGITDQTLTPDSAEDLFIQLGDHHFRSANDVIFEYSYDGGYPFSWSFRNDAWPFMYFSSAAAIFVGEQVYSPVNTPAAQNTDFLYAKFASALAKIKQVPHTSAVASSLVKEAENLLAKLGKLNA